mmetsp:Transcript_15611/g.23944  ORF Transcript_15611/g.23944 Transcript_15611/m.23944 type:complete len:109 (+) Transcript_15611:366-692(+)
MRPNEQPSPTDLPFTSLPQNHFNYTIMHERPGEDKKGDRAWSPAGVRYSSKTNKRPQRPKEPISQEGSTGTGQVVSEEELANFKLEGRQIQKPAYMHPFLMHRRMIKS